MAERRDNSVLFSLKELRQIEDERIRMEQEAERARIEQDLQAKADAERRAREEEERKIRQDPVGTGSAILKRVFGALK